MIHLLIEHAVTTSVQKKFTSEILYIRKKFILSISNNTVDKGPVKMGKWLASIIAKLHIRSSQRDDLGVKGVLKPSDLPASNFSTKLFMQNSRPSLI